LGDGLLASFDTASGAVECAVEVQNAVAVDGRFQLRLGIHLGEIVEDDGDIHGNGVNIASRIQAVVGAGEIGISGVVYENIKNTTTVSATLLGDKGLKNVDTPVRLYTVVSGASPKPT
jgi:adenylate cyclase